MRSQLRYLAHKATDTQPALLSDKTESGNSGAPIFVTGEELLKYRN